MKPRSSEPPELRSAPLTFATIGGRLASLWTKDASWLPALLIAATIGAATNLAVFGVGHLTGSSSYWDLPEEDSRAYLFGYRYFLAEPWHWPVFTVHTMNVPYAKNIVFTDSIPFWAFVNKALATIVPPWRAFSERAYLGTWHLLNYVLQAVVGVAILRELGKRTYGQAALGAIFFLCYPPFIFRYGHASLSSHWLVLSALLLYFRTKPDTEMSKGTQAAFFAELSLAALINPYHVAMSFAVYLAALARSKRLRSALVGVPGSVLVIALSAALAGFFAREAKVQMVGFAIASANLLTPFVPRRTVDLRPDGGAEATAYQYEGYGYLGLGLLVLLVLALPHARRLGAVLRRHRFLFALAVLTSVFSLSNHVYLGSHRVATVSFPEQLRWLAEQYRAPGRFIWLPSYIFVVWLLVWAFERYRSVRGQALLLGVAALQFADGGLGEWKVLRRYVREPFQSFLVPTAGWRALVQSHGSVEVHPPYDCILDGTPFLDHVSQEVQYYASERAIPINGVYSARPTRDCVAEVGVRNALQPQPGTLYVLLPKVVSLSWRLEAQGASCGTFEHGRACSLDGAAIEVATRNGVLLPSPRPPLLQRGASTSLGEGGNDTVLQAGWSWAEPGGRWTVGSAALSFRVAGAPGTRATLHLESSIPICGSRTEGDVDVLVDGRVIGRLHYDGSNNSSEVTRSLPIPTPLSPLATLVELRALDPRSGRVLGCNGDDRSLGVWVRRFWVD